MSHPELLDAGRSLLVVIDLQGKIFSMTHRHGMVKAVAIRLIRLAELFHVPCLLTEQYPKGLGATDPDVRAAWDALTVPKRFSERISFGCYGDAGFRDAVNGLRPGRLEDLQIVVAGIEAHVCVMGTVIELLRTGHSVHVCWDAVTGRGEEYRRHALDRMRDAGAVLTNHESVAFEWARDKDHAAFRSMSAMLREGQPQDEAAGGSES